MTNLIHNILKNNNYYHNDRSKICSWESRRQYSTMRDITHTEFMASYDLLRKDKQPYHVNEREYFSKIFIAIKEGVKSTNYTSLAPTHLLVIAPFIVDVILIFKASLNQPHKYLKGDVYFDCLRFNICLYVENEMDNLPDCYPKSLHNTLRNAPPTKEQGANSQLFMGIYFLNPLQLPPRHNEKKS